MKVTREYKVVNRALNNVKEKGELKQRDKIIVVKRYLEGRQMKAK